MMVECWYMGHTYRGGKSGCKMVTEFDSYSYDGVSAGIWVIYRGARGTPFAEKNQLSSF